MNDKEKFREMAKKIQKLLAEYSENYVGNIAVGDNGIVLGQNINGDVFLNYSNQHANLKQKVFDENSGDTEESGGRKIEVE